jgi:Fe-S-cluster containining protein
MNPGVASTTVQLTIHGRPLELKITAPVAPVTARAMLPLFRSMADTFASLSEQHARSQGMSVSCTKGCGACCRQLVPVAPIEAIELREMIHSMPEPRRSEILRRFDDARKRLEAAGLMDKMRRLPTFSREELAALGIEYFACGVACPFLEAESCSIHPQRPLACREFLVVSPAEFCRQPQERKIRRTELFADVGGAVRALRPGESAPAEPWIPLILALDFADTHRDEGAPRPGTEWADRLLAVLRKQPAQRTDGR